MNIEIKNGVVTKDGDEIGVIQDSICHLSEKVGPTVKGAIRKESGIENLTFSVAETPDEVARMGKAILSNAPETTDEACAIARTLGADADALRADGFTGEVKVLTSCPACMQGLSRYRNDIDADPDYIVVEMAKRILGENWMADYVKTVNNGGIERVLV